jgi:formylglycine-generating enzyme required for sulfatase activity
VAGRFWSVVALMLAAGAAAADPAVPLAWRLKEKDQFYAEWTLLQVLQTRLNEAQSQSMEDTRLVTRFTVLQEQADGGAVLEMEVRACRARALGKDVTPLASRMEGARVRVTLDRDRAVTKIDGLDQVLARLTGPSGPDSKPLREGVEREFRFWLDNIFYPLPGRPLQEGQTWQHTQELGTTGDRVERLTRTFTAGGEELVEDRRLRKITFTTRSRYVFEGAEDPGILNRRPRPEITAQKQGGTLYYDPAAGRLASGRLERFLQARAEGRLGGQAVDLGLEVHVAITLHLTDRDPAAAVPRRVAARPAGAAEEQEAAARRPRKLTNSLGMQLVRIPAGKFTMGAAANQPGRTDWEEQHEVEITRPFWMGAHEVTIGQYRRFVEATGYRTEAEKNGKGGVGYDKETGRVDMNRGYSWKHPGWEVTDDHPVVNLSWQDCKAFCDWLSHKEGKKYRLPTEAEWEYACRAGSTTRYCSGDDPETLVKVGNVVDASAHKRFPQWQAREADDHFAFTAPVGSFRPNAFGLYDMHGNALEWCEDWLWYVDPQDDRDPHGPPFGCLRAQRGGSWADFPYQCTSSRRAGLAPNHYCISSGFRVVVPLDEPSHTRKSGPSRARGTAE